MNSISTLCRRQRRLLLAAGYLLVLVLRSCICASPSAYRPKATTG